VRHFLLKLYFGKVYFQEKIIGDNTPEMTAGITGCLPFIYLYLIILMILDLYTDITIIKESVFLIISAICIFFGYKLIRRKDKPYLELAQEFTEKTKTEKNRIMLLSWVVDIVIFIILGIIAVNYHELMFPK